MIRHPETDNQKGFTLVELIITMAVFLLVIAAASRIFTGLLTQFKQQSKVIETNIEGVVGLELLRYDLEQAGYGIPAAIGAAIAYNEAVTPADVYNDSPSFPPRPVVLANNAGLNGSDYLVIKSSSVATNDPAYRWSYIANWGSVNLPPQSWNDPNENLSLGDKVIVMNPVVKDATGTITKMALVTSGSNFSTTFSPDLANWGSNYLPTANSYDVRLIYGLRSGGAEPRMPFNRADYYIRRPTSGLPARCAPNTGILYKATVNHADGGLLELPVLDCVADMRVVLMMDTDLTPATPNTATNFTLAASSTAAATIRSQLKEIRVYIIAQEGQRDPTYTSWSTINVSDPDFGGIVGYSTNGILDPNYRWKLYSLVVKPFNLER